MIRDVPLKRSTAIETFKDRALAKYKNQIDKMILFGSVARGDAELGSDIDILVLWKGKRFDGLKALGKIAFDILLETEEYISLKVLTTLDFDALKEMNSRFALNVKDEGVVIVG